jgi:hypothetical protein
MARTLLRAFRPRTPATGRAFVPVVEALETRWTPTVTFAGPKTFALGSNPSSVAWGDFNGDGRPDLAVANQSSDSVSVMLNTTAVGAPTPSFAAQRTFAVNATPNDVVVGDFNGDGRPDLAVNVVFSYSFSVLLNTTPAGASTPSFARQTFTLGPALVAVGDFNGDGRPDLAVPNGDSKVLVLVNTTAAGATAVSFADQQAFDTGGGPHSVAVGDFNGDGRPDLTVGNSYDNTLSILLNTTAAGDSTLSFAAQMTFAVGTGPAAVDEADFNGDGRPDLVVANSGSTFHPESSVSVLLNTTSAGAASPTFAAQQTFAGTLHPGTEADFDGDGRPDLVMGNGNNTFSVLLDTTAAGASTFSFAATQTFAAGSAPVAAADFNGDGRPDLAAVTGSFTSGTLSVLLNTTNTFASAVSVVVGQFSSTGVWQLNRATNSWSQLTAANATLLAADPQGDVVGEFPGYGVWEHRLSSGWQHLNGIDATALAMNAQGDVVAAFPGYGVGEYLPSTGWRLLTGANASVLAIDALGDVAGAFPGAGVWEFRPASGWRHLNGVDASRLAMDALGDVVANFLGYGVGEYRPASGWALLNGVQAQSLAMDAEGHVTAQFKGYGVGEYLPTSGWRSLTTADAVRVAMVGSGSVFGDFAGSGIWEYDPFRGWFKLTNAVASALAVA